MKHFMAIQVAVVGILLTVACKDEKPQPLPTPLNNATAQGTLVRGDKTHAECASPEQFTLDTSPYWSWEVYKAAHDLDLIDMNPGKLGPYEFARCIDLVVAPKAYEKTIEAYGASATDAVTITNMDVFLVAQSRRSVVVAPTSRSHGADAVVGPRSYTSMKDLEGKKVHLLAASVSEYAFLRCAQEQGADAAKIEIVPSTPTDILTAFDNKDESVEVGVLWNPELHKALKSRDDLHVICSSTAAEDEIIDMLVVAQDALNRKGGDRFVGLLLDVYYGLNDQLKTDDRAWRAMGRNFDEDLDVETLKSDIAAKTQMYPSRADGARVLAESHLLPIMKRVESLWLERGHVSRASTYAVSDKDDGKVELRFTSQYMKR